MPDLRRRPRRTPESQPEDLAYQKWLGERIRTLRTAVQLNQDDFSYVAGIQRSYVGLVENGKRDLRINTIRRIAVAFGLQLHQLLDPNFELSTEQIRSIINQKDKLG